MVLHISRVQHQEDSTIPDHVLHPATCPGYVDHPS
uniref:Uncharacterized protein n=1 Tax=Anguilla anguilla TaxID=7936 RepID=A0A0E9UJG8_ANGAN